MIFDILEQSVKGIRQQDGGTEQLGLNYLTGQESSLLPHAYTQRFNLKKLVNLANGMSSTRS
jgi:hypothetical protein